MENMKPEQFAESLRSILQNSEDVEKNEYIEQKSYGEEKDEERDAELDAELERIFDELFESLADECEEQP